MNFEKIKTSIILSVWVRMRKIKVAILQEIINVEERRNNKELVYTTRSSGIVKMVRNTKGLTKNDKSHVCSQIAAEKKTTETMCDKRRSFARHYNLSLGRYGKTIYIFPMMYNWSWHSIRIHRYWVLWNTQ